MAEGESRMGAASRNFEALWLSTGRACTVDREQPGQRTLKVSSLFITVSSKGTQIPRASVSLYSSDFPSSYYLPTRGRVPFDPLGIASQDHRLAVDCPKDAVQQRETAPFMLSAISIARVSNLDALVLPQADHLVNRAEKLLS